MWTVDRRAHSDGGFRLDALMRTAVRQNLAIAAPLTVGNTWVNLATSSYGHFVPGDGGVLVGAIEFYNTLFRADAWACVWELCDPLRTSKGWGIDKWILPYCSREGRLGAGAMRLGLLTGMRQTHLAAMYPTWKVCPAKDATMRQASARAQARAMSNLSSWKGLDLPKPVSPKSFDASDATFTMLNTLAGIQQPWRW